MPTKKILLLSTYDAQSHRYWRTQLVNQFPYYDWEVLALKDRYFSWRMGGNALNLKAHYDQQLSKEYDLIIATSMTDLSTLLGLYPQLAKPSKHLYFHENQFAYPVNNKQKGLLEIKVRHVYAALVADHLWFNSNYNRNSFLTGVEQLSSDMPDGIPADLVQSLKTKSKVLPVPIADDCQPITNKITQPQNIQVVWNHRWEHDKGPETLLELIQLCKNKNHIKFHIIGKQFRTLPTAMQKILDNHQLQCLSLGYIESREQYIKTLQQADVVLSTALHEFQGIAMLEAVACGCIPIAPDRLVYPELYPANNLYPSTPKKPLQEALAVMRLLENLDQLQHIPLSGDWQGLQTAYSQLLHH